jgi:stage III sporulation protein SpoIIIAA
MAKKRDNETGELSDGAEALRQTMRQCADELDEALALKVGVMDSESKAAGIASQRTGAMQAVAARLREAALE